jgi:hypothetical protein
LLPLRREFALLESLKYSRLKVIQQGEVKAQSLPKPANEGRYVEHQFAEGSSGPFGKELPGAWLSKAEALSLYRKIFLAIGFTETTVS